MEKVTINTLIMGEAIQQGQQIEKVSLFGKENGEWVEITEVGSIGYKKIVEFSDLTVEGLKIVFTQFREKLNVNYMSLLNIEK